MRRAGGGLWLKKHPKHLHASAGRQHETVNLRHSHGPTDWVRTVHVTGPREYGFL